MLYVYVCEHICMYVCIRVQCENVCMYVWECVNVHMCVDECVGALPVSECPSVGSKAPCLLRERTGLK